LKSAKLAPNGRAKTLSALKDLPGEAKLCGEAKPYGEAIIASPTARSKASKAKSKVFLV